MEESCNPNVISIGSVTAPKLDIFAITNDNKTLHVYDARFIRLLSDIFRVPYRVFKPQDGEFGRKLHDGNWSGIMGMVLRSETDLAVGGVPLNEDAFHAVNFSYPHLLTDFTFMTDKLKPVSINLAILNPFPLKLWIYIMAVVFFFSFLIFFLTNKTRTYAGVLLKVYGTILQQSFLTELKKTSHRLLICAWLIFSFVITNSYKAIFLSILTLPKFTGIQDISDLTQAAQRNLLACYSFDNKLHSQELIQSGFDFWKPISRCLKENDITADVIEEAFVKAKPGKAFLSGRIYLQPYRQKYFISEDSFFTTMYAFPLSKSFSCNKPYLNKMIHRLSAAGLFHKIDKDEVVYQELKLLKSNTNEPNKIKALKINDLKGAFLVLLAGCILSAVVFFIEIAINYYFENKRKIRSKTETKISLRNIERKNTLKENF